MKLYYWLGYAAFPGTGFQVSATIVLLFGSTGNRDNNMFSCGTRYMSHFAYMFL